MCQSTIDVFFNDFEETSKREKMIIETPRSKRKVLVELYNCNIEYLKTVGKVICIHPANHSVALFLQMKDKADLCLYCHPLLAKETSKDFVISYTQKFNYPLVILTRIENIEDLCRENGCPTRFRRWCTRMFKIEPVRLFYKPFIPSGVIEYIGIQKFHSKERSEMNPELIEDKKFGTILYIWFREFIKPEFMKVFSAMTENLFILSREKTFENATKFGLNNVQPTALFNGTIRESDNFFDAVIVPYHYKDESVLGITKQQILKEAFRITKSSGVVIIHGFVPIPNIDHGILNIFVKWVKEIYKGLIFYTEEQFKGELLNAGANKAETFVYKGHLFGVGRK